MSFDGLLNTFCDIYSLVKTQDTTTRQMVESWILKHGNIRCRLDPLSGDERNVADTILSTATHRLFLKYGYNFLINNTGAYRITINNVNYDIVDSQNAGGQGKHLELLLRLRK